MVALAMVALAMAVTCEDGWLALMSSSLSALTRHGDGG